MADTGQGTSGSEGASQVTTPRKTLSAWRTSLDVGFTTPDRKTKETLRDDVCSTAAPSPAATVQDSPAFTSPCSPSLQWQVDPVAGQHAVFHADHSCGSFFADIPFSEFEPSENLQLHVRSRRHHQSVAELCKWPDVPVFPIVREQASFFALPYEVQEIVWLSFLGCPSCVAPFACASSDLWKRFLDPEGRLFVSMFVASRAQIVLEGLHRCSFLHLRELIVDLLPESANVLRTDVERIVCRLGESLASGLGSLLRVLRVRFATYDASMARLQLRDEAWHALVAGLEGLALHQRLKHLELSFLPIKQSRASREIQYGVEFLRQFTMDSEDPPTLLKVLGRLCSLEHLVLAHDDLFSNTALELSKQLRNLPRLKTLDVTRNYISKQAIRELKAELGPRVDVIGADLQTFAWGQ